MIRTPEEALRIAARVWVEDRSPTKPSIEAVALSFGITDHETIRRAMRLASKWRDRDPGDPFPDDTPSSVEILRKVRLAA